MENKLEAPLREPDMSAATADWARNRRAGWKIWFKELIYVDTYDTPYRIFISDQNSKSPLSYIDGVFVPQIQEAYKTWLIEQALFE